MTPPRETSGTDARLVIHIRAEPHALAQGRGDAGLAAQAGALHEALDGQFRPSDLSEDTASRRAILIREYDFETVRVGAETFDSRL